MAALLFIGALLIKRSTMTWLFFILLGMAAAVASATIGFALTMIGLALTRDRITRDRYMNRAMLPTFLFCKFVLFVLKRSTRQDHHEFQIER